MPELAPTPSIAVTIGGQIRIYHAFVTTAAPALDGPSTMPLHASTLADVAGFAADPIVHDSARSKTPARLVLIETRELTWHRARYTRPSTASALLQIRCWSASGPFSTGSGSVSRRLPPARFTHESRHLRLVGVNRSPHWRAFEEVTS